MKIVRAMSVLWSNISWPVNSLIFFMCVVCVFSAGGCCDVCGVCILCRRVNTLSADTLDLEMDISPRVNQINLMTDDFLTTFNVPYNIQVFAENGIGEGSGSNPIVFTRMSTLSSEYISITFII